MALPSRELRHPFLRREVHRVQVFDFGGLLDLMAKGLSARMLMEHRDAQGVSLFTSRAWRRLFDIRGSLVHELILEFFSTFRFGNAILDLDTHRGISSAGYFLGTTPFYTAIRDLILKLCHRLIACSIARKSQAPKKVTMTDLFYLRGMDVGSVNVPYLLARYLRLFAARRKSGAHISGGQFVARLAEHFGLLTAEILGGLTAWVAIGPERQPDAAASALAVAEDAPAADEGDQVVLAPVQAPQQPTPPPPAATGTVPRRLEEEVQGLRRDVGSLRRLIERAMIDQGRYCTWMMSCMTQLMDASGLTY
ncbi:hypothetical protein Tco_1422768, partial [Tanacetum coccineum]